MYKFFSTRWLCQAEKSNPNIFLKKYDQVIKEKYPGAVSSQPTKKTSNGNVGKDAKKSGKGKGKKKLIKQI